MSQDPKFLEAVERAKMIAAKIQREAAGAAPTSASAVKRPHDETSPPQESPPKKPVPQADEIESKLAEFRGASGAAQNSGGGLSDRRPGFGSQSGGSNFNFGLSSSLGPDIPKLGEGPPLLQGIIRNGEKYLDMMIQGTKVGLIIGKGGETIRSLQDRAGVKLTIHQQVNDASEPEKQLRIIGEPDKVDRCREMITDLLIEKEMERANRSGGLGMGMQRDRNDRQNDRYNEYGSSERGPPFGQQDRQRHGGMNDRSGGPFMGGSKEVAVAPNFIGLVIGKGGESIKRIQQESGTKVQFDTTKTDAQGNKICCISGPPECVRRAEQLIQEIIDNAASNRGNMNNRFMGGEEVRYPVPANRCGAVIGRGGETIRVIKQQSGCDIELDKMSKNMGGDEKVFIIRGPPDRIPLAQQLINEKVRGGNASPQQHQESSGGFGSQSGDYSFNNYIQAQHGIPPVNDGASAQSETLNYYAQYYAAIAAQQEGATAVNHHPANNGQSSVQPNAGTPAQSTGGDGSQDYTKQWIEYYRAYGMHKEADQIEAMAKASKGHASHEGNGTEVKTSISYPGFPYGSK